MIGRRIIQSMLLLLTSMLTMAQGAIIDIPQTIVLESGQLQLNVITAKSSNAMYQVALVDDTGNLLSQSMIFLNESYGQYNLQLPIGTTGRAWLEVRTGNEQSTTEIYILPRQTQLSSNSAKSSAIELMDLAQVDYDQDKGVYLIEDELVGKPIYMSSSDQLFNGASLEFDQVEPWVSYAVEVEDGSASQALILDQSQMIGMATVRVENRLILTLDQSHIGSQPVAINKLSNTILRINPVLTNYKSERYLDLDEEMISYLANQLLIAELIEAPIEFVSKKSELLKDQSWQSTIGKPTIDVDPRDYIDFDNVASFIDEVVKNIRIYQNADSSYGSYVYPIQTSQSIRQPLYLIDNQVSSIDYLLSIDQRKVSQIRVYTDVGKLTEQIGPAGSAGLVIVSTEENGSSPIFSVGDNLSSSVSSTVGTLSPIAFSGKVEEEGYIHNERLGNFQIRLILMTENGLEQHQTLINVNKNSN